MSTRSSAVRFILLPFVAVLLLISGTGALAQQTGKLDDDVMAVLGRPEGPAPADQAATQRAKEIDSKLRCPVCQGVSIADSPSGMATSMREQVRSLVAAGYSDEQVLSYFERSYGEFVRLDPPMRGLNWLLWSMPVLALTLGGLGLFFRSRPTPARPGEDAAPAEGPLNLSDDPAMAKYLERIRRDSGLSS